MHAYVVCVGQKNEDFDWLRGEGDILSDFVDVLLDSLTMKISCHLEDVPLCHTATVSMNSAPHLLGGARHYTIYHYHGG